MPAAKRSRAACSSGKMHQAGAQISLVVRVALREFFAALIKLPKLPLRCLVVQPRHARERERRRAARDNHLQTLVEAAAASMLAAMVQPQDARVRMPSMVVALSCSLTPMTAQAAVPRTSEPLA
jgi:hypothetical protein